MRQLYKIGAVLAEERGVLLVPTCATCDGDLPSLLIIACPVCELRFCGVCWHQHAGSSNRCSMSAIDDAHDAERRSWEEFHADLRKKEEHL